MLSKRVFQIPPLTSPPPQLWQRSTRGVGKMIVEKERAAYVKGVIKELSKVLTKEFGKVFSVDNLENMKRLYLTYGKSETLSRVSENTNQQTVSVELRKFYIQETF